MEKISLRRLTKENSHAAHCILCHDGGGNLYACYRVACGKVYHIDCYDPSNPREPDDYWKCLMCKKKEEFDDYSNETDRWGNMGERDFYLCFRLMLELKSNWPMSRTFEPSETLDSEQYRSLIHHPIAMDVIQQRLNRSKGDNKYTNCIEFFQEVRRMFSNCRTFWTVNTAFSYSAGMYMRHADQLEKYFDKKLQDYEKLFSYYVDPADIPSPPKRKPGQEERRPEPYVPSFMLLDTPEKPTHGKSKSTYTKRLYDELHPLREHKVDSFGKTPPKPKKCFVCHKEDKPDANTHKCSKCKRGYHSECYVPALKRDPPEDWNCIMCVNVDDLGDQPNEPGKEGGKLGKQDYLICSRLFLELHQVWPDVKTFLLMEALDFSMYRNVINHPVALDLIRKKLDRKSPLQYESVKEFLKDVRLMFRNCKTFWADQPVGENFIKHADNMKEHLDKCLQEFQPLLQLKLGGKDKDEKKKSNDNYRSKVKDPRKSKYDDDEPSPRRTRGMKKERGEEGDEEEDGEEEEESSTRGRKPGPKFSKGKEDKKTKVKREADESESEEDDSSKRRDRKHKKIKKESGDSESEDEKSSKRKDRKSRRVKEEQEESQSEDDKPLKRKENKSSKVKKEENGSEIEEVETSRRKDNKKSKPKREVEESDSEEDRSSKRKERKKSKHKRHMEDSESEEDRSSRRKEKKKSKKKKDSEDSESEDDRYSKRKEKKKSKKRKESKDSDSEEYRSSRRKEKKKSKSKAESEDSESEEEMSSKRKEKKKSKAKKDTEESESENDRSSRQKDKKKSKLKEETDDSNSENEKSSKLKDKKKSKLKEENEESESEEEGSSKQKDGKKKNAKVEKKEPEGEEVAPLTKITRSKTESTRAREESESQKQGPISTRRVSSKGEKQTDAEIQREMAEQAMETEKNNKGDQYECNYCNACYGKLIKMEDHTLNHFEEKLASLLPMLYKPHKCPTCDKTYQESDLLMRHYAFDCTTVNETQECIRKNLEKKNPNEWEL